MAKFKVGDRVSWTGNTGNMQGNNPGPNQANPGTQGNPVNPHGNPANLQGNPANSARYPQPANPGNTASEIGTVSVVNASNNTYKVKDSAGNELPQVFQEADLTAA